MTPDPKPKSRAARPGLLTGLVAGAAITLGGYMIVDHGHGEQVRPISAAPQVLLPSQEPGAVRLADPQQRARIAITEAVADAVPLSASIPAHLDFDENVSARLTVPVDGRIARMRHGVGDTVEAGEALMEIDAPELAAAIADAARADNDLRFKRAAQTRADELYSIGVVARKDLEVTRLDAANAATELTRARLRLRSLNAAASVRGEYFVLSSPVAGIVTERNATLGQQVRADSGAVLMMVTDPTRLALLIDTPEETAVRIRPGTAIRFVVDAWPGETFQAQVNRVGPQVDPATRRVPVRASVDNSDRRLRPGMFARAWASSADSARGVRVPVTALLTTSGKLALFVQREPGIYEYREVVVAIQQAESAWLASGVEPGELVVSGGALLLNAEMNER